MITPAAMMEELLNSSCSNPCYSDGSPESPNYGMTYGDPADKGYSRYRIELCCIVYTVIAKKEMGHWVIKRFEQEH